MFKKKRKNMVLFFLNVCLNVSHGIAKGRRRLKSKRKKNWKIIEIKRKWIIIEAFLFSLSTIKRSWKNKKLLKKEKRKSLVRSFIYIYNRITMFSPRVKRLFYAIITSRPFNRIKFREFLRNDPFGKLVAKRWFYFKPKFLISRHYFYYPPFPV